MLQDISIDELFRRFGPGYRWFVTISGMIGAMSMVLSATMVNVAVPSIMGAFGVGQDLAQWAATAFLATMVTSQLLNAWAVRAFGQRLAYTMTLINFVCGALIAATAANIELLVLGRIMQGFSAGIIQPLVMATIVQVFPENRRGFAVGVYGLGVTLAPSFGPFLGGLVVDHFTWRHVFIAPIPLVAFAFVMGLVFMPSKKFDPKMPRFDWLGYGLLVVALICIMGGIGNGQRWGWSSDGIVAMFAIGLTSAVLFVTSQLHSKNPLLDPTLFLDARFASAMVIAFAFGFGNFATNYSIPVFAQTVQGYTATKAGMVLIPAGLFLVSLIPLSGRLADRVPSHLPIMGGCLIFAASTWLLSHSDVNTAYWAMAGYTILSRVAIGLVMPNMGATAMRSVSADRLNSAAGAYNFIRQMGGAFGVNVTVVAVEMRTAFHADVLASTQTPANPQTQAFLRETEKMLHEGGVPDHLLRPRALDFLGETIYEQAQTFGFQDGFLVLTVVFVAALIPAYVLGRSRTRAPGRTTS